MSKCLFDFPKNNELSLLKEDHYSYRVFMVCPSCHKEWDRLRSTAEVYGTPPKDPFCSKECLEQGPTENNCGHLMCNTLKTGPNIKD